MRFTDTGDVAAGLGSSRSASIPMATDQPLPTSRRPEWPMVIGGHLPNGFLLLPEQERNMDSRFTGMMRP